MSHMPDFITCIVCKLWMFDSTGLRSILGLDLYSDLSLLCYLIVQVPSHGRHSNAKQNFFLWKLGHVGSQNIPFFCGFKKYKLNFVTKVFFAKKVLQLLHPESTQSAVPVRFLILCSTSIILLASLVPGRKPSVQLV
jgi:hypothetical protein